MAFFDPKQYSTNDLLPHDAPMQLIDEVLKISADSIEVRVDMNKIGLLTTFCCNQI